MAPFQRRFREIAGGSRQISTIRIPQRKLINSFGTISRLISPGAPFDVPRIFFVSSKLLARKLSVSVEPTAPIEGRSRVGRSCFSERCINFLYVRICTWYKMSQSCFTLDISRLVVKVPFCSLVSFYECFRDSFKSMLSRMSICVCAMHEPVPGIACVSVGVIPFAQPSKNSR